MPFSVFSDYQELIPFSITYEAKHAKGLTKELQDFLQEVHPFLQTPNLELISVLNDYVNRYPHIPIFKSHLHTAYLKLGEHRKAREMISLIRAKHPDYLFGRLILAGQNIGAKSGTLIRELLGEELWLHKLMPEEKVFHVTEVSGYYNIAIRQLLEEGRLEAARERSKVLILILPDTELTNELVLEISLEMYKAKEQLMKEENKSKFIPKSFSKISKKYPASKEMPVFENESIHAFYRHGVEDLADDIIEELNNTDRASLARDAERVIADAIKRYEYFQKKTSKEQIEDIYFLEHAIKMAVAFRLTEVIPTLLDLFRSDGKCMDYWLTSYTGYLCEELISLGFPTYKEQYLQLVCEKNVYGQGKTMVSFGVMKALTQSPDLLEEGVQWFLEVFDFFAKHPKDKALIDSAFLSFSLSYVLLLHDQRFIKPLQIAYEKGWTLTSILGTLDEGIDFLEKPFDPTLFDVDPIPTDLVEYYKIEDESKIDELLVPDKLENDLFEAYYTKVLKDELSGYLGKEAPAPPAHHLIYDLDTPDDLVELHKPQGTVINTNKVGRNDPCPCGSGKKYKHCCMRK